MKVAEPEVSVTVASPIQSGPLSSAGSAVEFEHICNLHLEQLAAQVPMIASWVVYQDWNRDSRQWMLYQTRSRLLFDPIALSYLETQNGWMEDAVLLGVQTIAIPQMSHTYLCYLGQQGLQPEYMLVWAAEPLSLQQQQAIQRCGQLIHPYLHLCRTNWRQQAEVRLMEQVVQRTEHQLRNPLALISLYAENLLHQLQPGSASEQVTIIRDTVKSLTANLKDLLGCSQRTRLRIGLYDIRPILESSIAGLQPWLAIKQLHVHYPKTEALLPVDRWQLQQVFDNLLSNAIHFSPHGGTIAVDWQMFQQEALITIRDNGPGLSETDLERLFTPFYSRRPGGTGLGLAIAKKIILDHHGTVWADNVPNSGAQFSISLPR